MADRGTPPGADLCPVRANHERPWVKPTNMSPQPRSALKGPNGRSIPAELVQFAWRRFPLVETCGYSRKAPSGPGGEPERRLISNSFINRIRSGACCRLLGASVLALTFTPTARFNFGNAPAH